MSNNKKSKFIRDPIHDIIEVDSDALKIIDTFAFQRLRRIKQLGVGWFVYPSAEHSRFSHSIGTYHVAKKVLNILNNSSGVSFDKDIKKSLLYAALLHDIGHGPFSHLLERASEVIKSHFNLKYKFDHTLMSKKILSDDKQLNKCINKDLLTQIENILFEEQTLQHSIISSQLDVDRLDYLLRDCHFTGAKYGMFDLNWLLSNFVIGKADKPQEVKGKEVIAIDLRKGLSVLEQYILGRFYMHKHVYFHKVTRGFEAVMVNIFKRIYYLDNNKLIGTDILKKLFNGNISVGDFLNLDDYVLFSWMKEWLINSKDAILKSLIQRIFYRKPFKSFDLLYDKIEPKNIPKEDERIKNCYSSRDKYDYLFFWDDPKTFAYKDEYSLENILQEIFIRTEKGEILPLSKIGDNTIIDSRPALKLEINKWYMPLYIRDKYNKEREES